MVAKSNDDGGTLPVPSGVERFGKVSVSSARVGRSCEDPRSRGQADGGDPDGYGKVNRDESEAR